VLDEAIAAHALLHKDRILPPILRRSRLAFEEVQAWMAQQRDMEWVEPSGGVVCFPRIKPDSGVVVDDFYRILNGKYSTFVGPGHWFEMERRYMRIGYGWPKAAELTEGLRNITLALDEAKG
jgi:aspartate/methionine/tyrosine aminotransferase